MPSRTPAVLIIIDGLCAAAPEATRCPSIAALRARGASTLAATSLMPSITLPCHMSIFHSVPPTRHGITTNTYQPMGGRCRACWMWPMRPA